MGRRRESSAALRLRGPGRGRCWAMGPLRPNQGCGAGRPGTGKGSHGGGAFPQGTGCGPLRSRGRGGAALRHGRPCLSCLQPDWSEGCLARLLSSRLRPLLAGSLAERTGGGCGGGEACRGGRALAVAVARRSHMREQSQVSAWVSVFNRPSEGNL